MARSPNETTPRQFRLGEDTLELLDLIAAHFQTKSRAYAIRIAARMIADQLDLQPAPPPKKKPKKPKKGC